MNKNVKALLHVLGGDDCARIVGGAVRNQLMGLPITDIDVATIYPPDKVQELSEKAGFSAIPTGLDHGTITVIVKGTAYEVTTLRRDVCTDGRRAVVAFSTNWLEDAKRRDFTMNALYMDAQGTIYDPLGTGVVDAKAATIRFIGDANNRIKEDALRVLRFFRFHAQYNGKDYDDAALQACHLHADLLAGLSQERITQELTKICMAKGAADVCKIMSDHHIFTACGFDICNVAALDDLIIRQNQCHGDHMIPRFLSLFQNHEAIVNNLRLSRKHVNFLRALHRGKGVDLSTKHALMEIIYHQGRDIALQMYLLYANAYDADDVDCIQSWDVPTFPVTGADLIAEGYISGPELGGELKRRERIWIANGFKD